MTWLRQQLVLLLAAAAVGVGAGLSSALFLFALEVVTHTRVAHRELVWLLPLGGLALGVLVTRFGTKDSPITLLFHGAMNENAPRVPWRVAPLVLVGTLVTHLFGGSAGREGTAVQMGGALADALASRLPTPLRRHLLIAGIAGGFAAVFGTPLAGALFGLEVVVVRRWQWRSAIPAFVAAFIGDVVCRATGITHTHFPTIDASADWWRWLALALAVGLVTVAFVETLHGIKRVAKKLTAHVPLRLFAGGLVVLALWQLSGTDDYLGLGVPGIERAFTVTPPPAAFAWKLLFTAVTLGFGFLGGEVTPLFFVGATLGGALAEPLGLPLAAAAGVGLAGVFGAASKSPVALAVMAAELMGVHLLAPALLVCVVASLVSGRSGIYERSVTNL